MFRLGEDQGGAGHSEQLLRPVSRAGRGPRVQRLVRSLLLPQLHHRLYRLRQCWHRHWGWQLGPAVSRLRPGAHHPTGPCALAPQQWQRQRQEHGSTQRCWESERQRQCTGSTADAGLRLRVGRCQGTSADLLWLLSAPLICLHAVSHRTVIFSCCCAQGLSRKSILDKVDLNLFQSSTKIEALMEVSSLRDFSLLLVLTNCACHFHRSCTRCRARTWAPRRSCSASSLTCWTSSRTGCSAAACSASSSRAAWASSSATSASRPSRPTRTSRSCSSASRPEAWPSTSPSPVASS